MGTQNLLNFLRLAYSPISNYDFSIVKDDKLISQYMNSGKLYIIAQRPVLTIEDLKPGDNTKRDPYFTFRIHQRGNIESLKCSFSIYNDKLGNAKDALIQVGVTYAYPKPLNEPNAFPFNHVANIVLKLQDGSYVWLTPEKFIYHHLRETIESHIDGDIESFLNYNVHYIGKATKQDIVKRLTGHSRLHDVLSQERSLQFGSLPTDEIAILIFDFEDNLFMSSYGKRDSLKGAVDILMGRMPIEEETIYLDAEKAFINALKPKHNRQLYKNYPLSSDGLSGMKLNAYTYSIVDPITLRYSDVEIRGNNADTIIVKGNRVSLKTS